MKSASPDRKEAQIGVFEKVSEKSSPAAFLAGLAIVIGIIVLVSFGFARTFLWNNYNSIVGNAIILGGIITGAVLTVIGVIVLSFLSRELPQKQVEEQSN